MTVRGDNCTLKEEPPLLSLEAPEGVEIGEPLFLLPPQPCCAQLALPYWARITGTLANRRPEEAVLSVRAILLADDGSVRAAYDDTIALEAGEEGRYDILVKEFLRDSAGYRIVVTEMNDL